MLGIYIYIFLDLFLKLRANFLHCSFYSLTQEKLPSYSSLPDFFFYLSSIVHLGDRFWIQLPTRLCLTTAYRSIFVNRFYWRVALTTSLHIAHGDFHASMPKKMVGSRIVLLIILKFFLSGLTQKSAHP